MACILESLIPSLPSVFGKLHGGPKRCTGVKGWLVWDPSLLTVLNVNSTSTCFVCCPCPVQTIKLHMRSQVPRGSPFHGSLGYKYLSLMSFLLVKSYSLLSSNYSAVWQVPCGSASASWGLKETRSPRRGHAFSVCISWSPEN